VQTPRGREREAGMHRSSAGETAPSRLHVQPPGPDATPTCRMQDQPAGGEAEGILGVLHASAGNASAARKHARVSGAARQNTRAGTRGRDKVATEMPYFQVCRDRLMRPALYGSHCRQPQCYGSRHIMKNHATAQQQKARETGNISSAGYLCR